MPLSGSNKTEYQKEYMRRKRSNSKGLTKEEYPAILLALCDPKKRVMLEFISSDLIRKGIGANTWYGIGGPDMEVVNELLEVTR